MCLCVVFVRRFLICLLVSVDTSRSPRISSSIFAHGPGIIMPVSARGDFAPVHTVKSIHKIA